MIEALRTGDNQTFATLVKGCPPFQLLFLEYMLWQRGPLRSSGRNLGTSFLIWGYFLFWDLPFISGPIFLIKKMRNVNIWLLFFNLFQRSDEHFVNLMSCSAM